MPHAGKLGCHGRIGSTTVIATLGVFVTYLPIYAVAVSLATIAADTGATTAELQWVAVAYVIPMAAGVLSAGVFGDLHGRRRMFSLGLVLTVIGSVGSGVAGLLDSAALPVLWTGQAITGLGAGVLLPTTLALIAQAVPDPKARGRYIAMWAAGMTAGLAVGPVLAGAIVAVGSWGWIFAPTVVLSIVILVVGYLRLPESKAPAGRHLDVPGQIAATIAMVAIIFGVIEGGALGWGSAPRWRCSRSSA